MNRVGIRKPGNAGTVAGTSLVTTTAGNDLLHTIALTTIGQQTFTAKSFVIRKVMWYNNTGANVTLSIGTLNATPAFVVMLPTILALNTFDGQLREEDLPAVEFMSVQVAAAAAVRYNGNAYVLASAAGVLISIEVEEFA